MGHAVTDPTYGINLRRSKRKADDRMAWLILGSSEIAVEVQDVSPEGACLVSPRPISVGRKVTYQIGIRESGDRFEAVCVRCTPAPGGWELGLCHQLDLHALSGRASATFTVHSAST